MNEHPPGRATVGRTALAPEQVPRSYGVGVSLPPYIASPFIATWSVSQPDLATVRVCVQFVGDRKRHHFWVLGRGVKRRPMTIGALATYRQGPLLYCSMAQADALRDGALAIGRLVHQAPIGTKVAADWLGALRAKDVERMLQISEFARTGGLPAVPAPKRDGDLESLRSASELLRGRGRPADARDVDHLISHFAQVAPREQATSGQAARAIVEAFGHLQRLTPAMRTQIGADGNSAEQDALVTVDAAMSHVRAVAQATAEGDLQALRALRLYAGQWQPRDADPLNLDETGPSA